MKYQHHHIYNQYLPFFSFFCYLFIFLSFLSSLGYFHEYHAALKEAPCTLIYFNHFFSPLILFILSLILCPYPGHQYEIRLKQSQSQASLRQVNLKLLHKNAQEDSLIIMSIKKFRHAMSARLFIKLV